MSLRRILIACSVALLTAATACSSDSSTITGPQAQPDPLLGGLIGTTNKLLFCPTSNTYTTTQIVGPDGGTIQVGPHSLTIPAGALTSDTEISATAPAGNYVVVQFQ